MAEESDSPERNDWLNMNLEVQTASPEQFDGVAELDGTFLPQALLERNHHKSLQLDHSPPAAISSPIEILPSSCE